MPRGQMTNATAAQNLMEASEPVRNAMVAFLTKDTQHPAVQAKEYLGKCAPDEAEEVLKVLTATVKERADSQPDDAPKEKKGPDAGPAAPPEKGKPVTKPAPPKK